MKQWTEKEKKQLIIFTLIAFGLPVLMGIVMGFSYFKGNDVSAFPNVQMYYPAAGVMLALILTKEKEQKLPKKYFTGFLISTLILMVTAFISVAVPSLNWMVLGQYPILILSIVCLILLLVEKKEVRAAYGLKFSGKKGTKSWFYVLLFLVLYIVRMLISCLIEGQVNLFIDIFTDPVTYIVMLSLVVSFFLSFTAFFGEEYGWRFFFQPLLQKRFGLKGGIIILGVLWGLWHLPINIFFYSPDTWMISVVLQIITCISFAIFFGYGYMKTENIWVPVMMHFINNNMIPLVTGTVDISNQVYRWVDIPIVILTNLIFIIFIFSKVFKKKEERS